MFGFVYGLMGGLFDELPRRRRTAGTLEHSGSLSRMGDFIVEDGVDVPGEPYYQRGEIPGAATNDALENEGTTVVEEVKKLVKPPKAVK